MQTLRDRSTFLGVYPTADGLTVSAGFERGAACIDVNLTDHEAIVHIAALKQALERKGVKL